MDCAFYRSWRLDVLILQHFLNWVRVVGSIQLYNDCTVPIVAEQEVEEKALATSSPPSNQNGGAAMSTIRTRASRETVLRFFTVCSDNYDIFVTS